MITFLSDLTDWSYKCILKPILFSIPPDHVHENFLILGKFLGGIPGVKPFFTVAYAYSDPRLTQTVAGIEFPHPLGLAAGHDYLAYTPPITDALGIGFHTVGTITSGSYPGNTPPLYKRLPKSQSLWVNKGFKSPGVDKIAQTIKALPELGIPLGASVGATNREYATIEELINEYILCFKALRNVKKIAYYELNISCPNLKVGISLYNRESLAKLIRAVNALKLEKPIFVKMPIDLNDKQFRELLDEIIGGKIEGIIVGNLTKKRNNPVLWKTETQTLPAHGGLSGLPTQAQSDHLISVAAKYARIKSYPLVIIGCGGIFTGLDAYRKLQAGATLLQFVTGMIYGGPQVIGRIHKELAELLERDGFSHISEIHGK